MVRRGSLPVLVSFILLVPASLFAQGDRGTITGIVTDPTGAAVPEAEVSATHTATNIVTTTRTGATGNYALLRLPIGTYRITAKAAGFRTHQQTGVPVQVDQSTRLDVPLSVGAITEMVEVTAAPPVLQTESAEVGMVVNSREFLQLPLSLGGGLRHPMTFGQLQPGVTPGATYDTKRISGGMSFADRVYYDGVALNRASADPFHVSVESIDEFKLVSNNYSAEFARATGGVTTFTIRSGTNALHGSGFWFNGIEKYNARNFFQPTRPPYKQNSWGGTIGGPVVLPKLYDGRNRTFFFFSLEWYHRRSPGTAGLGTVPTSPMLGGDFGEWVAAGRGIIYDPATGRTDASGRYVRDAFPNGVIPKVRWSQVSSNLVALHPNPDYPGLTSNYQLNPAAPGGSQRTEGFKIDHQFSSDHRLSTLVNITDRPDTKGSNGLYGPLESHSVQRGTTRVVRVSDDWVVNPTTLNRLAVGLSRFRNPMLSTSWNQGWTQKLGLKGLAGDNMPVVAFSHDYVGFADLTSYDRYFTALSLVDTLTLTRSSHSLKFGFEMQQHQTNQVVLNNVGGSFSFNRLSTGLPGVTNSGNAFASFLLGDVYNGSAYFPYLNSGHRRAYFSPWMTDDWKVTRRLTLNVGIRWEIQPPIIDPNNRFSWMDPDVPNEAIGGFKGAYVFAGTGPGMYGKSRIGNTHWRDLSPRFGFAFRLTEHTVARGGYGIFYAAGEGSGANAWGSEGFNTSAAFSSPDNGIRPAFNWDAGFPQNFQRAPIFNPGLRNTQSAGMVDWDRSTLIPYNQQYNLIIEHQVTSKLSMSGGYVANLGRRIDSPEVFSQLHPAYLALGDLLRRPITDAAVRAAGYREPFTGFPSIWGARGTLAQALRMYPQYTDVMVYGSGATGAAPNGLSNYHSFQFKAEKRMDRGLFFTVAYTFSKFLSETSGGMDVYNRKLERSYESGDQPHILTFSYIYELPFGRGRSMLTSGVAGKILGGWTVTGIQSYSSGSPIGVGTTNTLPIFNPGMRPNVVSGDVRAPLKGDFDPGRGDLWLNPAAFQNPAPFTFGNAPRMLNVRTSARLAESVGLLRDFRFGERRNIQFRMEGSNPLNRVVFGGPVTNFSSASFGTIGSAGAGRQVQFGLKVSF